MADALRRPSVTATIGALVGLGVGIILGRSTVSAPEPHGVTAAPSTAEAALSPVNRPLPEPEPERLDEFRADLGRRVPTGRKGRGFEPVRIGEQKAAGVGGEDAVLRVNLDANDGDYVLTAVVGLEGVAKGATLEPRWDGKPLQAWALEPGWHMYSSPVPRELLALDQHELGLRSAPGLKAELGVDSVAVFAVTDRVALSMGAAATGHLIEGFANPSGKTVWSVGPRSSVGLVLTPVAGAYRLVVRGAALAALAPMTVDCQLNGKAIGTLEFREKASDAVLAVSPGTLRAGVNRLQLSYPRTAKPAELNPSSKDRRPLAVRFSRISLFPE